MGNWNHYRTRALSNIFALTAIALLIAVSASGAAPVKKQPDSPMVAKCKSDLAKRLKLQAQEIKLIESQPTMWPDAALGMPEPGKMYAQVITSGFRVTLAARNTRYLYVTSAKAFKYAGPLPIWSLSMFYTKPVANEANLNGDLYQSSLLGTNAVRIASGVADFYPQAKGAVIFTTRTSRSGFDLMYLKSGQAKPKKLSSAFSFGAAAFNSKQDKWAAIVRHMLGATWTIVVASTRDDKAKSQILPLPDGVRPQQIAWSGEKLMTLAKSEEKWSCYETTPGAAAPAWKAVDAYTFPGLPEYMLNKSESLEISEVEVDGKSGVDVALVWFTGDRNVQARVEGVTLKGYDFLAGRYAFFWGQKNGKPVAYTVDIATGELIAASGGVGSDVRPFASPPRSTPLAKNKP